MAQEETIYASQHLGPSVPIDSSWPDFVCRYNPDDVSNDKVVLEDLEEPYDSLTYGGLRHDAGVAAAFLQSMGLKPGDVVAIYASNSVAWLRAAYAVLWAGGVSAGINAMVSEFELPHYMSLARPKFVFVDPDLRERLARVLKTNTLPACTMLEIGTTGGHGFPYNVPQAPPLPPFQIEGDNREVPAVMLFSSGQ